MSLPPPPRFAMKLRFAILACALALVGFAAFATEPTRYTPGSPLLPAPKAEAPLAPGETVEVTLLVGYTATVARHRGRGLNAYIQELVDYTNASFARSQIPARLRLVGTARTTYRDTGDPSTDFYRLTDPADGHADDLHARRDEVKADLVILLMHARRGQECGISWLIEPGHAGNDRYGFGVVAHQWAARGSIDRNWESCFAHEIGHLFGGHHHPDNVRVNPAVAPYAHGYCHSRSPRFHTIMVWNNRRECITPIGHFSNPHVTWRSTPTGTVETHNNARIMSAQVHELAGFRGDDLGPEEPDPDDPDPRIRRVALTYYAISPTRPGAAGFVRIENLSDRDGTVDIRVSDDEGTFYPSFTIALDALAVTTLRVADIAERIGPSVGPLVLHSASTLEIRGAAYAYGPYWLTRTDVHLPANHDTPGVWTYRPRLFNPASNRAKRSVLHLSNPFANDAEVTITARDDSGNESDAAMVFTLSSGWAGNKTVTATELEEVWGDHFRKWRPEIRSTGELRVTNLLIGQDGYIASLP